MTAEDRDDPAREDADEQLDDLEPAEDEDGEVKGGGGSTQSLKPGSPPEN